MAAVITSLNPDHADIGGADVTMHVIGTGFTPDAVIVFNGGDEPTTYVSDTELTTVVRPSTATVEGAFPVMVRQADGESNEVDFTFAAAPVEVEPVVLVGHCYELCPVLPDCTLPTPWPPFVPPAAT
jgi:IPT/TIG domain-containing protein